MKRAAAELKFEEAARLRDQLLAIERSLERQKVATTDPMDQDVFGFYREGDRLLIYVALRAPGPAQRRPGLPLQRPGVPRRGAARRRS